MKNALLTIIVNNKNANTVFFISLFGLIFSLILFFDLPCLFRFVTSIPCPTCGITRAVISLLSGDLKSSLAYNPMALPVIIGLTGFLLFRTRKSQLMLLVILSCNIMVYFYRLINGLIP